MTPDAVIVAHHAALLAIPAFVPAVAITVVVLVIARRDRTAEKHEQETPPYDQTPSYEHSPEDDR